MYMGHRKFIQIDRRYRSQIGSFNGNPKHCIAPTIIQVPNIFVEIEGTEESLAKSESKKRKRNSQKDRNLNAIMWKKR